MEAVGSTVAPAPQELQDSLSRLGSLDDPEHGPRASPLRVATIAVSTLVDNREQHVERESGAAGTEASTVDRGGAREDASGQPEREKA